MESTSSASSRVRRIWCHLCKHQFDTTDANLYKCEKCQGDFCEEIAAENDDPRIFVPFGEEQAQQQQQQQPVQQMEYETTVPSIVSNSNGLQNIQQRPISYTIQMITNNGVHTTMTSTSSSTTPVMSRPHSHIPNAMNNNNNNNNVYSQMAGFSNIFERLFPSLGRQINGSGFFGNGNGVFNGQSFDNILDFLLRNDTNIHGTPPAANEAISSLPKVKFAKQEGFSDECTVCKEEFTEGEEVVKMPCNHLFHSECVTTWLKMHNSCPTCRFELPTDNADYERKRAEQMANSQSQSQQQQPPPTQ